MNRLRDSVKALSKGGATLTESQGHARRPQECKTMLEVTEACVNEARLPPCYDKVPPSSRWKGIDARASATIPVSRMRSGVVEATVELPVLLAKRWNRNNNDELAVSIPVSDHCGYPVHRAIVAEALGPAWTVGEGLFAGKEWKGGFLHPGPDRCFRRLSPKNHFLLHPVVRRRRSN